jgi:hypothetical protein
MKTRSYAGWRLRSFGIDQALLRPETAVAILMPLTVCIPHLVELDAPCVEMWRELGSRWKASETTLAITRDLLASVSAYEQLNCE